MTVCKFLTSSGRHHLDKLIRNPFRKSLFERDLRTGQPNHEPRSSDHGFGGSSFVRACKELRTFPGRFPDTRVLITTAPLSNYTANLALLRKESNFFLSRPSVSFINQRRNRSCPVLVADEKKMDEQKESWLTTIPVLPRILLACAMCLGIIVRFIKWIVK